MQKAAPPPWLASPRRSAAALLPSRAGFPFSQAAVSLLSDSSPFSQSVGAPLRDDSPSFQALGAPPRDDSPSFQALGAPPRVSSPFFQEGLILGLYRAIFRDML